MFLHGFCKINKERKEGEKEKEKISNKREKTKSKERYGISTSG